MTNLTISASSSGGETFQNALTTKTANTFPAANVSFHTPDFTSFEKGYIMSEFVIHAEISQPLAFVEQNFNQLKSLLTQPPCLEPTDGKTEDDLKQSLKYKAIGFADKIAASIESVAEMFGMNPRRLKVTIHYAVTRDDRYLEELQNRVIELHKAFHKTLKEHDMLRFPVPCKMRVHSYGVSKNPYRYRKSKSRRDFENGNVEDW